MDPFIDVDTFEAMWDGATLSAAQEQTVMLLLQVTSNWIYANKPGVAGPTPGPADPAAQLVTYEVVANALRFARFAPLKDFSNTTAHRQESGTLDDPASALDFTDRHKLLLGIPLRSTPVGSFCFGEFSDPMFYGGYGGYDAASGFSGYVGYNSFGGFVGACDIEDVDG